MLVEFRFYLFTLIAVFLALGTGMFIGSALPGNQVMAEKQDAVMAAIQKEFDAFRQREKTFAERVAELEAEVRAGNEFAARVLPVLVEGRLAGARVGVVTTADPSPAAQVAGVLRQAGAEVEQVTPGVVLPSDGRPPDALRAVWRAEARRLAQGLLAPGPAADPAPTGEGRAGEAPTGGGRAPLAGVVLLAGGGRPPAFIQSLAEGLAEALTPRGVRIIGAEMRDTRPSFIPVFMKLGLSTVDDVDLLSGQAALVLLLDGAEGNYGIKETAQGVLPLLPVPQPEVRR